MKRVPTQTPSAPRASAAAEPAAVEDTAGRHDGHVRADGVDDLGDQRERRHLAGVATGLGALGHHQIAAGLDRPHSVLHLAAHADDHHLVAMALLHHLSRHAEPGHERLGAAFDDELHLLAHSARHGGQQVDPEGLVGARPGRPKSPPPSSRCPWSRRRGSRSHRPRRPPRRVRSTRRRPCRPA